MPGTFFAENDVRVAKLADDQIQIAREICSPEYNPKPWAEWRERLNNWVGGADTYQEIFDSVRVIQAYTLAENVELRRWWRGRSRPDLEKSGDGGPRGSPHLV